MSRRRALRTLVQSVSDIIIISRRFNTNNASLLPFHDSHRPPTTATLRFFCRGGDHADDSSSTSRLDEDFSLLRDSLVSTSQGFASPEGNATTHFSGEYSSDALSISDAIRNQNDGFDEKTQKFLRQFRGRLSESLVVEVLSLVQNPEPGVKFFLWAGRQIGYRHTGRVYDALLQTLQCDSECRVAGRFLEEIKSEDREVLGKLLNLMVRRHCRNGWWNVALEELGRLKDYGYRPSAVTYNALIQVFVKADRLDTAMVVHKEMSDCGFRMDEFTFGCFAHALCRVGKWRDPLALIDKDEIVPDTSLYNKMIAGLCEASLFDEAMNFLDRMRSISCIPNVMTYRVLLCGCLRKKQLGRCKRILSMMIPEGCYPHPMLFNSLVQAFCRSGDYGYAYKLVRKMVRCGLKPGYVVYNILIGSICGKEELPSSEILELAEKAYGEMLFSGVVLNKVNVINFAWCLCGVGKFEKAYNVINDMMTKGFVPDTSTYSKVIEFMCGSSKIEKAFLLFEEMKSNNVVPDVYTYTVLIDSFCKAGLIRQARNWFDEMLEKRCAPNVVTYTALIHAYLKARKVSEANKLFEMMLKDGCIPNAVTYTALIDGHFKAGNSEKALQIYERMKGNLSNPDLDINLRTVDGSSNQLSVFTYGALVDGLCKAHRVGEAHDLLNTMVREGIEPNNIVYDALIDGFCKAGKLDEAQNVFSKMSELGYIPTLYTYGSLIDRLFKDKRLDLVLKVLSNMLENSCSPNVVIYTQMIDGLCKVGKLDEAYKLLLMMEEKRCYPNVVTYTAMIDGFGKRGKIEKCLDLFKEMSSKGCAPNFITYRVLINHCCSTGRLDEAHKLLDEMKQTYWPKHIGSYQKVIEGYSREFLASHGILDEMGWYDSVPIISTYNILIDNFVKVGKVEVALELYGEISSSAPLTLGSKNMYASLIASLSSTGNVGKGFELFADMLQRGGVPDLGIVVHLIIGLTRVERWDDAFQLSDSICQMDIHWQEEEALDGG